MSFQEKLRKILLLSMIGVASFGGAAIDPQKIEDLQRLMNQTQIELSIHNEGDDGFEPPNRNAGGDR